jgi:hypothetical protein
VTEENLKSHFPKGTQYEILNRNAYEMDFNALTNNADKRKLQSLVFFLGGVSIDFEKLKKLDKYDLYIINVGPVGYKEKFEKAGFCVVSEKIKENKNRSGIVERYIKYSGSFQSTYNIPHGYRIYKYRKPASTKG